jgi:hypothetical protein
MRRLLGREPQLGLLRQALDRAISGRGGLVVVSGEPGIGKSALVSAFAEEAESKATLAWGRAWEFADAPPYFPVGPFFRALSVSATGTGEFELWERVLEALARASGPQVWVIEDLHAADLLTLDLLVYLTAPIRALPVLLVVTTRVLDPRVSDRVAQRLRRLRRDAVEIALGPLETADVEHIIEEISGRPIGASALARVVERTGGNPLFVTECARLSHDGVATVPATVREVVADRFALLGEATRAALFAASIVGREFASATIARMQSTLGARVIDTLAPAVRAGLVEELRPGQFRFTHAIVRDAIEAEASAELRQDLHARAERALAAEGEGSLIERARHALSASLPHAVELAERAAAQLEGEGAADRAFALHLRIDEAQRVSPERRLHLASLARAAGKHADAARLCEEVAAEARARSDATLLAQAALSRGEELRPGVVDRRLVGLLEEALALESDGALACLLRARLAAALQPAADPQFPVAMARDAIAAARETGDERVLLRVLETAGSALVDFAPIEERVAVAEELFELAERCGDRPKMLRALTRIALDRAELADDRAVDLAVERALAISSDLADPRHRWRALFLASMRAIARGDVAGSDRHLTEVRAIAALTDDPALELTLEAHVLTRARILGDVETMKRSLANILLATRGLPGADAIAGVLSASVFVRTGDRPAVVTELARVRPHVRSIESDAGFHALYAEACAFAGTDAERRRAREVLVPSVGRDVTGGHVSMTHDHTVGRVLGLLDRSLGDEEGTRRLERELASAIARGYHAWADQLRRDLGRAAPVPAPPIATAELTMHRDGDFFRIKLGDRSLQLKDVRGLHLLARLVERPREELHVLALASDTGAAVQESSSGEALDPKARLEYVARLRAIDAELEEADVGVRQRLHRERDMIESELSRAFGLGGRARRTGSATERARINVQRRIKDAIARIAEHDEVIGRYLEQAVRTGTWCSFRP